MNRLLGLSATPIFRISLATFLTLVSTNLVHDSFALDLGTTTERFQQAGRHRNEKSNSMNHEIQPAPIRDDSKGSMSGCAASYPLASFPSETCLVVSFTGTISNTSGNEDNYRFMHEMIGSGFAACNPATMILDFRGLKYDSDEYMCRILDQRLIVKVVVSDLNRDELANLVANKLFLDPKKELFESIAVALDACDDAYRRFLSDGRKKTIAADF